MSKPSVVVVINPAARGINKRKINILEEYFGKNSDLRDFVLSRQAGDIEKMARRVSEDPSLDTFIVAGGDGTMNEAINGLTPAGPNLGFIPGGTANVIRYELGIPGDTVSSAKIAMSGNFIRVRPGVCNGRKFLLVAGIGIDAEIVRAVSNGLKEHFGKAEYVRTGIYKALNTKFPPIEVFRDNEKIGSFKWVVIARSSYYAGSFKLVKEASINKDSLFAYMFWREGFFNYLFYTLKTITGLPFSERDSAKERGFSFGVRSEGHVPYHLDGDFRGVLPLDVSLSNEWVKINVPPGRRSVDDT